MRILHTSDLHGRVDILLNALSCADFDLWLDTGDFFPNKTRGEEYIETVFQKEWFEGTPEWISAPGPGPKWSGAAPAITELLKGRPAVCVGGNHDYVSLAAILKAVGADAYEVTTKGIEAGGLKFAGFPHIPWIAGEWNNEIHDFRDLVDETFRSNPDVLVTHAPPAGILDVYHGESCGIESLMSNLCYTEHKIQAHFFGHVHESGGSNLGVGTQLRHGLSLTPAPDSRISNMLFANGAGHAIVHEIYNLYGR